MCGGLETWRNVFWQIVNEKSQHQQYEGLNKFSQNSVDFSYIPIEHESDDEFELATDQKTF